MFNDTLPRRVFPTHGGRGIRETAPKAEKKQRSAKTSLLIIAMVAGIMMICAVAHGWEYMIGEGDILQISVWGEKELSQSVKVRPDGKITLPAVGEIIAANLSPIELQRVITAKLKKIVKTPVVTVTVEEVTNNKAYVFGGGVKSGVYILTQRTTLLQLLCLIGQEQAAAAGAAAGAATTSARNADLKNAYVLRNGEKIKQNFTNLFVNGDISEDIIIEPNDAIFIPAHTDKNVYVMGAVMTPKAIEYREGLTAMEAILEAGGFTKFASKNDTIILRKNGAGEMSIPVKIKKLMNGDLSQNVQLLPGDYVVVHEGIF